MLIVMMITDKFDNDNEDNVNGKDDDDDEYDDDNDETKCFMVVFPHLTPKITEAMKMERKRLKNNLALTLDWKSAAALRSPLANATSEARASITANHPTKGFMTRVRRANNIHE